MKTFRNEVYSKEWIDQKRRVLGDCDPGLLEKSIYALTLLGHLAKSGLPFIFKGGTSLMLHLPEIRRLSIDIDIVSPAEDPELERAVATIGTMSPFQGQEEDDRGKRGLPQRRHFKFYYPSPHAPNGKGVVLLDVVQESDIVHHCVTKPIRTSFLEPEEEIMVELPGIESLLGDKLTAFAPNTTGVPYRRKDGSVGEVMQVAKQLFDVGILFEHAQDFTEVAKAYDAEQEQEAIYRGREISRDESLDDTFNACLGVVATKPKHRPQGEDANLLLDGFRKLRGHLNWLKFSENDQRTLAARTAYLASCFKNGQEVTHYEGSKEQLEKLKSASHNGQPLSWVDGIKGINAEAYYYMFEAIQGNG